MFQCISICLNAFIDIVIGISPSYLHCHVFAMHTHLHICFSLYTMTYFPTCYTITFLLSMPIDPFQLSYNLFLFSTSIHHPTFHIPHSTFHVVTGCMEPKLIVKKCLKKYFHFYLFISIVVKLELVLI
jgi:hypothetical protein